MPTDVALSVLSQEDFASKKRVTFADHLGLPLARVKIFSQSDDAVRVPAGVRRRHAAAADDELVLDFPQPASDHVVFRQSVDRNCVRLETCALQGRTLAGTVQVKNLSFEKRVRLRVTRDRWRSHFDVDCAYVEERRPGAGACAGACAGGDSFAFSLPLGPSRQLEFAVCYQAAGAEYWDSNGGRNYRVLPAHDKRRRADERRADARVRLDAFGSLTCGRGVLPDWPGYRNAGPYY